MQLGGYARNAAGKNLSCFGSELRQKLWIEHIDLLYGDIVTTTRHLTIASAKTNTAFRCFRFCRHGLKSSETLEGLAHFAMQRTTAEEGIILYLLKTARRAEALLVARSDVTGRRLSFGLSLGAFKDNDVSWHGC